MAVILVVEDQGETKVYTLGRTAIIAGRSKHCNIILNNELCSGEHCQFVLSESGQAKIMDLGSTNGVSVNGSSTLHCKLFLGDEINMGEAKAWLDAGKMTVAERQLHTKDSDLKRSPPKLVIKLPSELKSKKAKGNDNLLASGNQGAGANHPHRTSTAIKNIRKARAIPGKKKN